MIPVDIENAKLKLALAIPTGAPITQAKEAINTLAFDSLFLSHKFSRKSSL